MNFFTHNGRYCDPSSRIILYKTSIFSIQCALNTEVIIYQNHLGNHSQLATCSYELFTRNDRYCDPSSRIILYKTSIFSIQCALNTEVIIHQTNLGNNSELATCSYELFTHNDRYCDSSSGITMYNTSIFRILCALNRGNNASNSKNSKLIISEPNQNYFSYVNDTFKCPCWHSTSSRVQTGTTQVSILESHF